MASVQARVIVRGDQEHATEDVIKEVSREAAVDLAPKESLVGEPQHNGTVECAAQDLQRQAGSMKPHIDLAGSACRMTTEQRIKGLQVSDVKSRSLHSGNRVGDLAQE